MVLEGGGGHPTLQKCPFPALHTILNTHAETQKSQQQGNRLWKEDIIQASWHRGLFSNPVPSWLLHLAGCFDTKALPHYAVQE